MTWNSRKFITFCLRWGIAIVGAWYVLSQLAWHDQVYTVLRPNSPPQWVNLIGDGSDTDPSFTITNPTTGDQQTIRRSATLIQTDKNGVQHPRVQIGVRHLLQSANHFYLIASLIIFPLTFLITAFRWQELLKALDIQLPIERTFILNMVGAFYNTFMPGSTGGDVLKAYYVARQTHHRTRAVMSVIVDRIIGLLALIVLGGTMAAVAVYKWHVPQAGRVALTAAGLIALTALGLLVYYVPLLRRACGLDWFMRKLPRQVHQAQEAMHLYGKRPGLATAALLVSFPVHGVVITSALLAGVAFGLHIPLYYYWTVVPVTVLVGALPLAPQGAGVMEFFAIKLLEPIGCTVAEAVVLTMSIRLVQVLWNLAGGVFVLRGGYHTPTASEQRQAEDEDEDIPHESAASNPPR
jgi:uncharacterized protein (TIRG00374 family)